MKIAIIGRRNSENTDDLVRSCRAASIDCEVYEMADITVDTQGISSNDFFMKDVYIFRGYNKSYHQVQALAQYLKATGKLVIDEVLAAGFVPSKFHEALVYEQNDIAHPRTLFVRSLADIDELKIELPVVVKDVDSQRGKGVRLANSMNDVRREVSENGGMIIMQEYVKMDYDLRVFCIGDKVLGAVKRYVIEGDFRSNVSLGSTTEPHALTEAERSLALRAHRALGYDISGVDIGCDNQGNIFIIETNSTPEWQGFQKATNIDVAKAVVAYAKERYEHAGQ